MEAAGDSGAWIAFDDHCSIADMSSDDDKIQEPMYDSAKFI
jgi:hypothetical protein